LSIGGSATGNVTPLVSQKPESDRLLVSQKPESDRLLAWLPNHLDYSTTPLLSEPWVLDMDSTVKTLYGHQESAEIGYNPHQPGRPSHAYHTYMLSSLRLALRVDVLPGDEYNVAMQPMACGGYWTIWGRDVARL
jgi:hypothetical protein